MTRGFRSRPSNRWKVRSNRDQRFSDRGVSRHASWVPRGLPPELSQGAGRERMESFAEMVCRPRRSVICETSAALEAVSLKDRRHLDRRSETAAQPCRCAVLRAVRPCFGLHRPSRPMLKSIVADRGRCTEAGFKVARFDQISIQLRMIPPHTSKAVCLQFHTRTDNAFPSGRDA